MRKSFFFVYAVAIVAIVVLAGCGGGGGGTSSSNNNSNTSSKRIISGKVVSSQSGSPGVADVIVKLGDGTSVANATTDSDGIFSFTLSSSSAAVPAYVQIDVTGAGLDYSTNYPVTYRSQTYKATYITIPVGVRNAVTDDLGTYTVAYLGGDTPPWFPYPSSDTILTGRIVRSDNYNAIPNVTVSFGTPAYTTTTGANGYFELNLGLDTLVSPLLPGDKVFKIDTSNAGSEYSTDLLVIYNGYVTSQSNIPVPLSMYNGDGQTDFGIIYVNITSSSGGGSGGVPDPPPF
jgi:hypothetical protein